MTGLLNIYGDYQLTLDYSWLYTYYNTQAIKDWQVENYMNENNSDQYCCIIEACHSGRFADHSSSGVYITACNHLQSAWENSSWNNSYFTYFVLEALTDNNADDGDADKFVSAEEIYPYVFQKVSDALEEDNKPDQEVRFKDNYSGELTLTVPIELTPSTKNVTATTTSTTITIENKGGDNRSWSIDSYPSWVTSVSPSSGTLSANQSQTITVYLNQNTGSERTGHIEYSYYGVDDDITIRQYSKVTTAGTLTCNEIWRANNTVTGDVIVPSNYSLTIASGNTVYLNSGTELSIYGTLSANGATFTRSGTTGSWDGIKFRSNSTGSITNSTIKYATYGTYCYYSNPTINNNTYNNNSYAIYLYQSSPTVSNNVVTSDYVYFNRSHPDMTNNYLNNTGYGIYFYYSSPYLLSNSIINSTQGPTVNSYYYSSPDFGPSNGSSTKGLNYLFSDEGDVVLLADNHSTPFLGSTVPCTPSTRMGGYNTIDEYHSSLVSTNNGSSIEAQWCWWGQYPITISDPNVNYDHALEEDPGAGSSLSKTTTTFVGISQDQVLSNWDYNSTADSLSRRATSLIYTKKYGIAVPILINIVKDYPNTKYSDKSISQIAKICQTENNYSLVKILKPLVNNTWNAKMKLILSDLMINGYIDNKDYSNAITIADSLIKGNPGTMQEYTTLFNLFNLYHKDLDNIPKAQQVLNQMVKKYPGYDLTLIAQFDMGQDVDMLLAKKYVSNPDDKETVNLIPSEFQLCSNYPNPFNPSTNIPFNLPEKSNVNITIYDLTGRTIKILVNEQFNEGTHRVIWDGTNDNGRLVSNGVYIYTMNADQYQKSMKMVLIR